MSYVHAFVWGIHMLELNQPRVRYLSTSVNTSKVTPRRNRVGLSLVIGAGIRLSGLK